MKGTEELRRLRTGPDPDEKLNGFFTESFVVRCPGNAEAVLNKAKEVMEIALQYRAEDWPSDAEWPSLLPAWFVAVCAPETSVEQAERDLEARKKLPHEERVEAARRRRWSLLGWVFCLHPNERCWWWWDACVRSQNELRVTIVVDGWPYGWSDLSWLLRASGGQEVIPPDEVA
jgi:hypothetical protein